MGKNKKSSDDIKEEHKDTQDDSLSSVTNDKDEVKTEVKEIQNKEDNALKETGIYCLYIMQIFLKIWD